MTLARDGVTVELRDLAKKHPDHGKPKQLTWRSA
jgi:hypothetical protein